MIEAEPILFGRTQVRAATGELVDQPVQAIVYAANARGLMGAGPPGSVRMAGGPEVEREAMAQAPLELGEAIVTTSGRLAERGIEAVIHAVVAPRLGDPAELPEVRRATAAALRLADARRFRSLALPLLGLSVEATPHDRETTIDAIVEEIVAHVRRGGSRLESIVIVSRFEDDLAAIEDALVRARQRLWTGQP
ncbi:MAG: hypothetical protein KatS3mg059_0286 [Thermomicrobiales bacterium]|nr:MAG: hypothetical protein KatS3mg059_0286 [Thermomicrobiales bacterium]